MWVELICGLVLFCLLELFLYPIHLDTSRFNVLIAVAKRLEQLYYGSKVYVGLQIPDADSGFRQNIDIVLVTKWEALVISVMNVRGFVSINKNGKWVCVEGLGKKAKCLPDPTVKPKLLVPILEAYLQRRGVVLPEGYLSGKVICPNPNFRAINSNVFPPEVITYDQWKQLKPKQKYTLSGWIKGAFCSAKKDMQESLNEKLCSTLSTAPMLDRLELKENKYILGEFIEFKGKQDDLLTLISIRRSKVRSLIVQKISKFDFACSTLLVLYSLRDYRCEGAASSEWKKATVSSSTEVVFKPQNSTKVHKFKLSSVISMSLSA
ncbi:uncharacterized protein LOC111406141 [Olea europaea var. sylvestris]|uniref:uncharacterized protein LOC111406141 n=1 Tax=Olea europaea var. sylvestris TaxID=158386 RepID=UPI000C1D8CD1|nr:uncharacterized protein LOC111406141 [Olea europaea var. sylvestris]